MNYKLNERCKDNKYTNMIEYLLYNNGISNPKEYIEYQGEHDYKLLNNIDNGLKIFDKHYSSNNNIAILVD